MPRSDGEHRAQAGPGATSRHGHGVHRLDDDGGQDPHYVGYWDSMPDVLPSIPLEEAPNTRSLSDAVAWGRQRTPRVLVRPESDPDEYYWAGAAMQA